MSAPAATAVPVLVTVRGRACPLCDTPAGKACQPRPEGDHLARYLDAYTAGQLTKDYMAMVLGELVVVDACAVIEWGEPGTGGWTGEISRRVVRKDEPAVPPVPAPKLNGPDGFTCDCGARLPWPSKAEDVTCPFCGTAWEHDGVTLGGGARIKVPASGQLSADCPSCGAPASAPCTGSFPCISRDYAARGEL